MTYFKISVLIGAAIALFLGGGHLAATLGSNPDGGPMMPTDPVTREAMQRLGGIGLAPDLEQPLYRAWIGFNLSHAFGVIAIALMVGIPALRDFEGALANPWWVLAVIGAPLIYLLLSARYWFSTPTIGISACAVFCLVGALGGLAAS